MKHKLLALGFILLTLSLVLLALTSFTPGSSSASILGWLMIGYLLDACFFAGALILLIKLLAFSINKVQSYNRHRREPKPEPKTTAGANKNAKVKLNWISLISAILILASIGLPLFSTSFYKLTVQANAPLGFYRDFSRHISLSIYYFGFVASANGITGIQAFPYWFNWVTSALILVAGTAAIIASFAQKRTRRRLMTLAGALSIVCSPLFLIGLYMTIASSLPSIGPLMWFSPSSFGLTQADVSNLHSQTGFPFFWVPIIVGIWALVSTKVEIKDRDEKPQQQT